MRYMPAAIARTIQVKILVSADERRMLDDLSDRLGLSVADVVRQLVRREHASLVEGGHRPSPAVRTETQRKKQRRKTTK